MKKKIAILGSTGSIGKNLINIIEKEKNKFQIDLLSAHKDYKTLFRQVQKFNVKNVIINVTHELPLCAIWNDNYSCHKCL